jgi:hypothetical protein
MFKWLQWAGHIEHMYSKGRKSLFSRPALRQDVKKRFESKPKTRWNEAVDDSKKMLSIRN